MKKTISVIYKTPEKPAETKSIPNTLEALQANVEGYIETVTVASDAVVIYNEEGRINDMPYNCTIFGTQFFGPILIAGRRRDNFDDVPVPLDRLLRFLPGLAEAEV